MGNHSVNVVAHLLPAHQFLPGKTGDVCPPTAGFVLGFFFLILTFFLNEFDLKSRREMILPEAGVCECVSILNQGNRLLCMPPSSPAVA